MASKNQKTTANSSISVVDLDLDENDVAENEFNTVVHNSDLRVGMVVGDEEEAFSLYNVYAFSKGFSVRKSKYLYKGRTNIIRGRKYVCNRKGKSDIDDPSKEKKVYRLETRTGCLAGVTFIIEGDSWVISTFSDDHNHVFIPPHQRHLLKSGRRIEEKSKEIIRSMTSSGIKPTKVYNFLAREAGGAENVGFTKRDTQNFLQRERENLIGPGDAQSLVNHFKRCLIDDPLFFHHEQLDEEGRMLNVFWTDGASRVDYDCCGDVVIFDTTYRTNKYNMICAPFVGVNHHWKNVFFGCAFLQDEKTPSFVWLFQTFLEAMGNKSPKTIFTEAMANAIKQVFPNTRHRLCTWHISKNATQHIAHLYANPKFKEKFNYLLKLCETETKFEPTWTTMIEEWGLKENKWLKKIYDLRENWSPAFGRDTFSGNIRSTQRSESTKNVFQQQSGKTMTLCEFVIQYEDCVTKMHHVEIEDDFNCSRGTPHLFVRGSGLLKHASEVYTLDIFQIIPR